MISTQKERCSKSCLVFSDAEISKLVLSPLLVYILMTYNFRTYNLNTVTLCFYTLRLTKTQRHLWERNRNILLNHCLLVIAFWCSIASSLLFPLFYYSIIVLLLSIILILYLLNYSIISQCKLKEYREMSLNKQLLLKSLLKHLHVKVL